MTTTNGTLSVPGARLYFKVRGRGPALLVIQGGTGDADSADALAAALGSEYTVISYDRRGLSRSTLEDPKQAVSVEQHSQDAHALLENVAGGSGFVFGSSLGALIALDLVARWPGCARTLVAHEPPLIELLPSVEQSRFAELRKMTAEIALSEGPRAAARRFLREMGVDRDDHEDDIEPPQSSRDRGRNTGFFLTRESRSVDRFRLELGNLTALSTTIVPAFGRSSRECFPARCALALAQALGCQASEFPGGHTGYVLRPRGFAETLRGVLAASVSCSRLRSSEGSLGRDGEVGLAPARIEVS